MTVPRLLGGRYEIGETLGYGGMAEVHRGRDTRLGRDVAVKVLRADLARDTAFQSRFKREAQNAASLNHPAIVAIYDTGEEPASDTSQPYIVMEYVEGRTLREVLNEEQRLLPRRALEITADVCAALEFSHRNGIVHRDIKPANVMLTAGGAVKVMDFGIARAVTSASATMTQTSAVIGTAQYLSPEQARGESVDARSDVYSTGCLLYELLVGQPPFTGDSPVSVAYQHVREDPVPPSELNADVSPAVDAVVLKALAKNPANRYQSAAEMRADLLRAANGQPVEATPVLPFDERTQAYAPVGAAAGAADATTLLRRPEEDRRRRRWLAWALLALLLALVFLGAVLLTKSILGNKPTMVPVPDVTGQPKAQAIQTLESRGFKVQETDVNQSDANAGKVIQQLPLGGKQEPYGSTVTITVDLGKKKAVVPQLIGLPQDSAMNALQQAGLQGTVKVVPSSKDKGVVVDASPKPGATVDAGSTVTLSVADGKVAVPDVVGSAQADAQNTLQSAGFQVSVTQQQTSAAQPGTVLSESPKAGTRADRGSAVTIVVAQAPPQPSPTPSPSPSSPAPSAPPTKLP